MSGTLTVLAPAVPSGTLARPSPVSSGIVGASLGLLTAVGLVLARGALGR